MPEMMTCASAKARSKATSWPDLTDSGVTSCTSIDEADAEGKSMICVVRGAG
jgi:hypothetical protein